MEELTINVSWIAVIVSAVIAFILGWVWYLPEVFGAKWADGVGLSFDDKAGMQTPALITQAIGTFFLAWVVGITAAHNALLTMIIITLAIVFLISAGGFFSKKSITAITIEAAYVVAMVVIMIITNAIF